MNNLLILRKLDGKKMDTCEFHCWKKTSSKVEVDHDLKEEFWVIVICKNL